MLIFDQLKKDDPQLRLLTAVALIGMSTLLGGLWYVQVVTSRKFLENQRTQAYRSVRIPQHRDIAVDLPNGAMPIDKEIVVPINVQGVADKGIISYEFDLRYDPAVIQPQADPVDLKVTVSRGLFAVANANKPGLLRVVMYGPLPIDENGLLLNLRFQAVGASGSMSPLIWERIIFNEGTPRITAANGLIELVP